MIVLTLTLIVAVLVLRALLAPRQEAAAQRTRDALDRGDRAGGCAGLLDSLLYLIIAIVLVGALVFGYFAAAMSIGG